MELSPSQLDIWLAAILGGLLKRYPVMDLGVQSAIRHNVLGGFWFAAALFAFWMIAARNSQQKVRIRILTILVGTTLTILLTIAAGAVVSWPPPIRYPGLARLFPSYLESYPNTNCFPSQSTALYATVAMGIYSLHRLTGTILWAAVAIVVAFPRMYVGGHYLTDVIVGVVLAFFGYAGARYLFEKRLVPMLDAFFESRPSLRTLRDLIVFVWFLQVAVEFRDAVWVTRILDALKG
jgi:membrane-associated phospholipid phosphatase